MNNKEKVDYDMTDEERGIAIEYDDLTKKIKDLDLNLKKAKAKLKSTRINEAEEIKTNIDIKEIERQIKYHIFARNKINDKLYGNGERK